jgi:hypothetical protein
MSGHIVFMRFFPGASPSFPYNRFSQVSDTSIKDIEDTLRDEWWADPAHQELVEAARRDAVRAERARKRRVQEWKEGGLANPTWSRHIPNKPAQSPSANRKTNFPLKGEIPTFREICPLAGWGTLDASWGFESAISHRFAVYRAKRAEDAEPISETLQRQSDELCRSFSARIRWNDEAVFFATINPRFSNVTVTELADSDRNIAELQLRRLLGPNDGYSSLEERFVRLFWPHMLSVFEAAHSTKPRPTAPIDGPFEPFGFRYVKDLSTFLHKLAVALWDSEHHRPHTKNITAVLEELWPEDEQADEKLKDVIKRLRKTFLAANISLTVKRRGGLIWMEEAISKGSQASP